MVFASTLMGLRREAAEWLSYPLEDFAFQTLFGVEYLNARGHHYLLTGRPNAAAEDFLKCGELVVKWRMDTPGVVSWRTGAAEAFLAMGDRRRAQELVREHLNQPAFGRSRTLGAALRLDAVMSKPGGVRLAELRKAVDFLESSGDRVELVKALADQGDAHYELGDTARARMVMQRAWDLADRCGATALSARFSPELVRGYTVVPEQIGRRHDNAIGLSEAERRVARLAAQGYTNRQIGERLYISVSTVEQHLTRIYRKLRVRHRTDIPLSV
jgi:DNA-binding CsgD family transcriptional regulator